MRQAAAAGLGSADRCTDSGRGLSVDTRRRALSPDRTTGRRQRITVGIPGQQDTGQQERGVTVMNELAGKVAIVTGGASGLGYASVEKFVAEGARVVIADRDEERGKQLADACGATARFQRV